MRAATSFNNDDRPPRSVRAGGDRVGKERTCEEEEERAGKAALNYASLSLVGG